MAQQTTRERQLPQDSTPIVRLARLRMAKRDRLLSAPDGIDDVSAAKWLKEIEPLKQIWEEYTAVRKLVFDNTNLIDKEKDTGMRELITEELVALEEQVQSHLVQMERVVLEPLLDPREAQATGALLEIRTGIGGQESTLFTAQVARMYERFCDQKPSVDEDGTSDPWKVEVLSTTSVDVSTSSTGGIHGLKEAIIEVKGKEAFRKLRFEAGVHRVQRIPSTQNLGKLQTSTIAVLVLPISEGNENKADDLVDPKDVKQEVMRSRGAGGQHVNKTESAVRLTHEPTGITVSMQDSRSQHQNRTKAWEILRARLLDRKLQEDVRDNREMRLAQVASNERSDRVRTYNFPQDRVTDHRINSSTNDIDGFMDGNHDYMRGLHGFMTELQNNSNTKKIQALLELEEKDAAQNTKQ